jgi:hypothetical protein
MPADAPSSVPIAVERPLDHLRLVQAGAMTCQVIDWPM